MARPKRSSTATAQSPSNQSAATRSSKRSRKEEDEGNDEAQVYNGTEQHREDDDDMNHREEAAAAEQQTRTSRRKRKKVKIMEQSNQTDAERRELRAKQRDLLKTITSTETGEMIENPESDAFDRVRQESNALFDSIRYSREAVLDGENLDLITSRVAKQVDKLIQLPTYDPIRLANKFRTKCTSTDGTFRWKLLGKESGSCFNAIPTASFFHGPMDADYQPKVQQRKVGQKRRKQVAEEEEELADEKEDTTNKADKLSAVEKHIKTVYRQLDKRHKKKLQKLKEEQEEDTSLDDTTKEQQTKKAEKDGICAIQYMFNPRSFTQTVENIFHFSFLVKKGDAGIHVITEDGVKRPMVRPVHTKQNQPPPRQAVVALDMAQWRDLVENYEVEHSDIPHRTGSRYAKKEDD